jgi:hypothetical protein
VVIEYQYYDVPDGRIAEKRPVAYEIAVDLLVDLREVEHRRKPALMERLASAGL